MNVKDFLSVSDGFDLLCECNRLAALLKANAPANDTVRVAVEAAIADGKAKPIDFARALFDFYKRPLRWQRAMLNGWEPTLDRPTRKHLNDCNDALQIHPALHLSLGGEGGVSGCIEHFLCVDVPVHVSIQQGTSREQAATLLRDALALVENAWDDLMDQGDDGVEPWMLDQAKEKSGTSRALPVAQLGSPIDMKDAGTMAAVS